MEKLDPRLTLNAHWHGEHLVDTADTTIEATQTGNWNEVSTWSLNRIPQAGDRVHIPDGIDVTLQSIQDDDLDWVRVDGGLLFAHNQNTRLEAENVVVSPTGSLKIGNGNNQRVWPGRTAELNLLTYDVDPQNSPADPMEMGRGLIVNGHFESWGSYKPSRVEAFGNILQGESVLVLNPSANLSKWRVGDEIAIPQTRFVDNRSTNAPGEFEHENEVRGIASIDLTTNLVTLDSPVNFNHKAVEGPDATSTADDMRFYVANLTRNVTIASADPNASLSNQPHTMFAHTNDVVINNTEFVSLGRTNKGANLNDWELDLQNVNPAVIKQNPSNRRGRYAVHFHRGYMDPVNPNGVSTVSGSVVNGSAGWGFVNHSSHVNFRSNVAHDVVGAGFVGEAGDETGEMYWNTAIHMTGSGLLAQEGGAANWRGRVRMDFGHSGHGIWAQGPAMKLKGNVIAGARGTGIWVDGRGLIELDLQQNLADPSRFGDLPAGIDTDKITWMAPGDYRYYVEPGTHIDGQALLSDLHPNEFLNNQVIASGTGVHFQRNHGGVGLGTTWSRITRSSRGHTFQTSGSIVGTQLANNRIGFSAIYFHNHEIINTTVIADSQAADSSFPGQANALPKTGVEIDEFASELRFNGGEVRGYDLGFDFFLEAGNSNKRTRTWAISSSFVIQVNAGGALIEDEDGLLIYNFVDIPADHLF